MRNFFYFYLGLFVVMSITCKKNYNPISGSETPKEIIPLSLSNYWTASITYYDSVSNVQSVDTLTKLVENEFVESGVKWYSIKTEDFSVSYRNTQEGFVRYLDNQLIYKYPASKEDSFPDPNGSNKIVVQSIDTIIVTPAGRFSCYCFCIPRGQIVEGKPGYYYLVFVSPGNGFIKQEHYIQWSPGTYSLYAKEELIKYFVK